MSTKIEWTDAVWNPTTGCNKVSDGCKNCYAEKMHKRLQGIGIEKYKRNFLDGAFPDEASLEIPLHWKKPRRVFVNSMSDLFHESVPFEFIDKVFAVMALCPQHTFQILTKRPEKAADYFNNYLHSENRAKKYIAQSVDDTSLAETIIDKFAGMPFDGDDDLMEAEEIVFDRLGYHQWPLFNVWIGTSVEDQVTAEERIPYLLQIPAAVRFLSCEPLLGEISLRWIGSKSFNDKILLEKGCLNEYDGLRNNIHWVICGGESGHGARPMNSDWAKKLRDDCKAAGVPYFFKQFGEWVAFDDMPKFYQKLLTQTNNILPTWKVANFQFPSDNRIFTLHKLGKKETGRLLDGVEHNEYPNSNQ